MMRIYKFDQLTPETILNRNIQTEENVDAAVDAVLAAVRANGDAALREYTKQLIEQLNRENPGVKERMFSAILNSQIKGYPERILNPRLKNKER